ncbi:MAG: hypothetical protein Q9211_003292 [Gyalolechia sp. 1 TL-2023]
MPKIISAPPYLRYLRYPRPKPPHLPFPIQAGNPGVAGRNSVHYFNDCREPFCITVAGVELYIITSPQDMSLVYRNTKTLSFDDFIRDLHVAFGMSSLGRGKMWDASQGKCLVHQANDFHREQLHPGPHLLSLTQKLLEQFERRLGLDDVLTTGNLVTREGHQPRTVSLYRWCADVMVPAATIAFFGEALLRVDPQLLSDFHAFDEDSWMLTYRYPAFLARKMSQGRQKNKEAFTRYFELSPKDRPGACHYVRAFEARLREVAMASSDMAVSFQLFFWVLNANAFKICFWLLTHLLHQPVTLEEIRKETEGSVINGEVDIDSLLGCALLNAAFDETLRLASGASSARTVVAPTQLRDKVLRKDTKLLMPYRQLHFQEAVFGPPVKGFRPERFLGDKNVGNSPNFKPFGGGITHCSGRFIARREVLAFVALVVHRYEVELADPSQALPRLDERKPTLGVIGPIKGDDTTIVIKPRSV